MDRTLIAAAVAALVVIVTVVMGSAWASGDRPTPTRADKVELTEAQWQEKLTEEEFRILRKAGTERAFTGEYWDDKQPGVYTCAGCGLELFHSEHKFKSGTGWPSYWAPVSEDNVDLHSDVSFGMVRTEVTCARCGGHLGHLFNDGPEPTGLRYCINGNVLDKVEAAPDVAEAGDKRSKKNEDAAE